MLATGYNKNARRRPRRPREFPAMSITMDGLFERAHREFGFLLHRAILSQNLCSTGCYQESVRANVCTTRFS